MVLAFVAHVFDLISILLPTLEMLGDGHGAPIVGTFNICSSLHGHYNTI